MAGGTIPAHAGAGEAKYFPNGGVKQGDLGSRVLPKGPPTASWKAGDIVEVAWGIRYNHGGGGNCRTCPRYLVDKTLTGLLPGHRLSVAIVPRN